MVGRALVRRGEILFFIDVVDGGLDLLPVKAYDIADGLIYLCEIAHPSGRSDRRVATADGIIHLKYATDPDKPWRGIGPIEAASLAGKLSAEVEKALGDKMADRMPA